MWMVVIQIIVGLLLVFPYVESLPPDITGLPSSINLIESATGSTTTSLYTLNVTDPEGDSFNCVITPAVTGFQVTANKLYLVTNPGFEYDTTSSYAIGFQCTDVNSETSTTQTLTVNILPNTPPTISGLPTSVQVNDGENGPKKIYDITVSDVENDAFSCSLSPTGTPFNYQSTPGHSIHLNSAPGLNAGTTASYTLTITCADSFGASQGTLTVNVIANGAPDITNLPATKTVQESDAGGSSIFTIAVSDPESDTFSCAMSSAPATTAFSLTYTTQYDINLNAGHGLDPGVVNSYTLTVTCTDSNSKASSSTLTVTVSPNAVPVITNLPTTVNVNEGETAKTELVALTVTDAESDSYTCSMTTTGPFSIEYVTTQYKIYLNAAPGLDYTSTPSYSIPVTCSDNYGSSTAKSLTVNVIQNAGPVFSGLPAAVSVTESDAGGSSIYTLTVTDTDPYTCSIQSSSPATTFFSMVKTGTQYDVHLNSGHSLEHDTVSSYGLTLQCTDGTASTGVLTVNVQSNTPPDITNLPATASVASGEAGGRTLHTLAVTETDTYTCTMSSTPASAQFTLNKVGAAYKIDLVSSPTFGGTSSFTLSVTCSDNWGSTSKDLTINVTPNSAPVITGMPTTVTVSETATAASCLHTVAVTDPETDTITCAVTSSPAGPFEMVQNPATPSYQVCLLSNAIATLDAVTAPTHDVTVTCTDSAGGSSSAILYVDVTKNEPPAITGLPVTVEVLEKEIVERKLHDLTVSDPEGDALICVLASTPTGGPFDLRRDAVTQAYSVYLDNLPGLNYSAVPSYTLTITCTDSPKGRSSNQTLQIDVLENRPPTFTNLPATGSPNAMTTLKYGSMFTVTATDLDLDTILYSMEISPKTDSFTINQVTGEITATRDLKYELTPNFVVNVTASDSRLSTHALYTITLTNINTQPTISSLILNGVTNLYFPELTTAAGVTLYTPTIYDPDAGQTQTITMNVYPSGQTNKFRVTGNNIALATGETFDYEDLNYYRLALYVTDTMATSGPYYLAIHVLDEPEVCNFPQNVYRYDTYEAGVGGGNIDVGFHALVEDKDNPDSHTFSLVASTNSKLFNISKSTGVITYAVDYDIDRAHPQNLTIVVKCTDKHGETGTATVSLYIKDVNDNEPDFTSSGYVMGINQYTKAGTRIGAVVANDIDQNENAEVEYDGTSATGSQYFKVMKDGSIYLTRDINFDYGMTHRVHVVAVDHGKPQLTGTSYVDIVYRESVTTSTTTAASTYQDWWSKPENVAMVAILSVLGLLLLALLAYLFYRCCLGRSCSTPNCKCCKPEPSNNLRKLKNPGPEKFKLWDANDLNKKRDPFSTAQMEEGLPEAMKM
ncbi:protocadherin Fat 4-like [Saccostrea echinata]|uniref:protocadherin Fat 4-like n=1 Tax=Saccostrea echinata TaxID=191078 RepID=UPI002A7ED0DC|nr:protocadherin Fat 4-like [Saccostrea echinata]